MRKKLELDKKFDTENFAKRLNDARGDMMIQDFAEKCNVSLAFMSRCLNEKLAAPPTPTTIRKIAEFTEKHGVSADELYNLAGYAAEKYVSKNEFFDGALKNQRCSMAAIKSALLMKDFRWSVVEHETKWTKKMTIDTLFAKNEGYFDLDAKIIDGEIDNWFFFYISQYTLGRNTVTGIVEDSLVKNVYSDIVFMDFIHNAKISVVTDSEVAYNLFKEMPPLLLKIPVSIVLVDSDRIEVVQEEYVNTGDFADEIIGKYVL